MFCLYVGPFGQGSNKSQELWENDGIECHVL
uniref:Uncharacterized protein n=1 Tax=Arundo donax TaxID=35708 RepID=A0A0A8YFR0_ARUDO